MDQIAPKLSAKFQSQGVIHLRDNGGFFQKFRRLHKVFQQVRCNLFPPIRRDNRDMDLTEMPVALVIRGDFRIIGYGSKSNGPLDLVKHHPSVHGIEGVGRPKKSFHHITVRQAAFLSKLTKNCFRQGEVSLPQIFRSLLRDKLHQGERLR